MSEEQSRYCKASSRDVGLQEWQIDVNAETENPLRFFVLLLALIVLQVMVLPNPSVALAKSVAFLLDANRTRRAAYIYGPYDHIYNTWRTPLLDTVTAAAVVKDKRLNLANVLGPNDDRRGRVDWRTADSTSTTRGYNERSRSRHANFSPRISQLGRPGGCLPLLATAVLSGVWLMVLVSKRYSLFTMKSLLLDRLGLSK